MCAAPNAPISLAEGSAWKEFLAYGPRDPEPRALALARVDPVGLWPEVIALVDDGALLVDPVRVFETACGILAVESTVAPTAPEAFLRKQSLGRAFATVLDTSDLEEPSPFRRRPLPERRALRGLLRGGPESLASRFHLRRLLESGGRLARTERTRRAGRGRDGP